MFQPGVSSPTEREVAASSSCALRSECCNTNATHSLPVPPPPLAGRPTFPAHPESVLRTLSGFALLFWFVEFLVNRRRHWQRGVSTLQPVDFVLLSTSGDTLLTPTWSPFSRRRTTKRRAALSWFWVSSWLFLVLSPYGASHFMFLFHLSTAPFCCIMGVLSLDFAPTSAFSFPHTDFSVCIGPLHWFRTPCA